MHVSNRKGDSIMAFDICEVRGRARRDRLVQTCVTEEEYARWQSAARARDIPLAQLLREQMRRLWTEEVPSVPPAVR